MKFNPLGLFHPKYLNLFLTRCSVFKDQTSDLTRFRSSPHLSGDFYNIPHCQLFGQAFF